MDNFEKNIQFEGYYDWKMLEKHLEETKNTLKKVKKRLGARYYNVPISFDIEVSSFKEGKEKKACMYIWSFNFNGLTYVGRTWEEYKNLLNIIKKELCIDNENRIIVYIHNLKYEFQFLRNHFKWDEVFAVKTRTPLYAVSDGIEYRCSYLLSGYSLNDLGNKLNLYNIKKMKGDLDYKKIRHSKTPLTDKEMQYVINDTRLLSAYIYKEIQMTKSKSIIQIPYTVTGRVRKECRERTLYNKENHGYYRDMMKALTLNNEEEYGMLKNAFLGALVYSNENKVNKVLKNVYSFDETTAYGYHQLTRRVPMSKGRRVKVKSIKEFKEMLEKWCCVFNIKFYGVEKKKDMPPFIGVNNCISIEDYVDYNNKLVNAEMVELTLNDIDYKNFIKVYDVKKIKVGTMYIYRPGYLPKEYVDFILELYEEKTKLKDTDKKLEYFKKKGMLNSLWGMLVMDINKGILEYDGEWGQRKPEDKFIEKYNNDTRRFTFYPWGIWITSYNRETVYRAVCELKDDLVYTDTDSVKFENIDKHKDYFEKYNNEVEERIKEFANVYGFDLERYSPKNIKGERFTIGKWSYEGMYDEFKTLGPKRYAFKKDGDYDFCISGLAPGTMKEYLKNNYENVLDAFNFDMIIPKEFSGKKTHLYIDDVIEGEVEDYMGKCYNYKELSGVYIEESEFSFDNTNEIIEIMLCGGVMI